MVRNRYGIYDFVFALLIICFLVWSLLELILLSFFLQMDSTSSVVRETQTMMMQETFNHKIPGRGKKLRELVERHAKWSLFSQQDPKFGSITQGQKDRDKCVCNYSHNTFSCFTSLGISNLKSHLEKCKNHLAWSAGQKDQHPDIDAEGKLKKAKLSESQLREATNKMVILGQLPLSFVENVAWRHFCIKVSWV